MRIYNEESGDFSRRIGIVLFGERVLTSKDNRPIGQVGGGIKYN
jgi:hypothetical protein